MWATLTTRRSIRILGFFIDMNYSRTKLAQAARSD